MATTITSETLPDGYAMWGKMSLVEFRAFPEEDGIDRILLAGMLWERPMAKRNRLHAGIEARIVYLLTHWLERESAFHLQVFSGEMGCEFPEIESSFGIDVAVFSRELLDQQAQAEPYIVGRPELAVEILSPSDSAVTIHGKIDQYLAAGVPLIWLVNPYLPGVTVLQPRQKPELLSGDDLLTGKEVLPEFQVPVSQLFV